MHAAIGAMALNTYGAEGVAEHIKEGAMASVLGINSLQMGVFGGIIVGLGVASLHNRFYKIQLPQVLSFFGGTRFVPIVSAAVYLVVGILMFFIWPAGPDRHYLYRQAGSKFRLFRHLGLRPHRTRSDPLWSAPRILSAFLADQRGRNHGDHGQDLGGRTKHLFRPAL